MESTITILVTGANGQLGNEFKELADSYPEFHFIFFTRNEFSIDDISSAKKIFETHQPQFLINCAAYTAVDKAESERDLAEAINGKAVGILACLCKDHHTKLIHISTDYVFNGEQNKALKETDEVDPVNVYGETKLLGEQLAMQNNPDSMIIRTSWVYSFYGKNFVKTMMKLMKERESLNVVNDQWGSPTYAADLAAAILQIIQSRTWFAGIYHYSNEGVISWFDFAIGIRNLIDASCIINPIATDQYPTPAKRPKHAVMDKSKITGTFQFIHLKDWRKSLEACIGKLEAIG